MDINDVIAVVDSESVSALCLSKGGWEGWLQCELWGYLNIVRNESAAREVPYPAPDNAKSCDLVTDQNPAQWIEIKAFGIFRQGDENRFLDSIANDVYRLDRRPRGAEGIALAVVPNAISESFMNALNQRGWLGFHQVQTRYATIFYMILDPA